MSNGAAAEWRADENLLSDGRPFKPRVRPPQAATRSDRRGDKLIGKSRAARLRAARLLPISLIALFVPS